LTKAQQRPDRGVDDRSDNAHANVERQQPVADEGSYDSDDESLMIP
jgi:hypothetical protein